MKSFGKTVLAAALAAAPLTGLMAQQQAKENNFILGWCKTQWGQTMQVQRDKDDIAAHQVHAAAHFTPSITKKYKGCQIKYVDFGVEPKQGSSVRVFVTTDVKDPNATVAAASTTEWEEGWNRCQLEIPYTIKGTEDLYVGYEVFIGENESMRTITYDNSIESEPDRNWYGADGMWYALNPAQVPANFRVRGILTGKAPDCDVALEKVISAEDYIEQKNGLWKPTLRVRNYGSEPITSLHIQATVNGQVVSEADTDDDFEIASSEVSDVEIAGLSFPDLGTAEVTLTITKVNGKDDPNMEDNAQTHTVFVYAEGGKVYKHNVLFEHFTSEYYSEAPAADELYQSEIGDRKDVIWVKHHRPYKGVPDIYTAEGETEYDKLFGSARPFVPGVCADRRIFVGQEDPGPVYFIATAGDVTGMVGGAQSIPAFVNVNVDVKKSADGKSLDATVSGASTTTVLQQQTDLRLTVWLVEDGIKSTTQEGRDEYVQNGVLRSLVNTAWGESLDLTALEYSRTYQIPLKEGWNADKMRVVAFISNYSTDEKKCQVYNSGQAFVNPATAITDVMDAAQPMAYCQDGKVLVAGSGFSVEGVFDVSGRAVANANLAPGLYIVRMTNGKTEATQKLCVK